jgi:hypothetical protein
VYEDILTSGTLDKPVSLGSVEPLDHAIFLQANSLSDLFHTLARTLRDTSSSRKALRQTLVRLECFGSCETITSIGLPSISNNEFLFELDDVMAGIGMECKKNLPAGTTRQKAAGGAGQEIQAKVVDAGPCGSFRDGCPGW